MKVDALLPTPHILLQLDALTLPYLGHRRQLRTLCHEVVAVVPLIRPRVPPVLRPDLKPLQDRAQHRLHLLRRQALAHAVHRPDRERDEPRPVMPELGQCRGGLELGGERGGVVRVKVVRVHVGPEKPSGGQHAGEAESGMHNNAAVGGESREGLTRFRRRSLSHPAGRSAGSLPGLGERRAESRYCRPRRSRLHICKGVIYYTGPSCKGRDSDSTKNWL